MKLLKKKKMRVLAKLKKEIKIRKYYMLKDLILNSIIIIT
jgi:hypothetical protein